MALNVPKEHGFDNLPPVDIVKVTEYFFDRWMEGPIFIYKEDGKIKGFVGVFIDSPWWSSTQVLSDYIFYVDPEARQGGVVFNALLGAYKDLAKLNKLPIFSNFMSNTRTPAKERLFERNGFKKSGFLVTYGI